MSKRRPDQNVRRIVHAKVQPRQRESSRQRIQRHRRQPDTRIQPRSRKRCGRMRARETKRRRRAGDRRQTRQLRPPTPHNQLDRSVQRINPSDGGRRPAPLISALAVERRPSGPDRKPNPRVLPQQREASDRPIGRGVCPCVRTRRSSPRSRLPRSEINLLGRAVGKRDKDTPSEVCWPKRGCERSECLPGSVHVLADLRSVGRGIAAPNVRPNRSRRAARCYPR